MIATMANAQAFDEVVDEDRYLRGLTELQLPEVLEHYLEQHPSMDAVEAIERRQHIDRLALRDSARSAAEREEIIARMLARYDELLESHPDDPRRAVWITDQTGDAYFEWMMLDTSMWTAMLGVPSREQQDRVRRAAGQMFELAERAERVVLDVIFQLEDEPGFMNDLAMQAQRRRLVDEHRDRRVPFLRGIAMHLHARFNIEHHSERAAMARRAAETLNDVIPRLQGQLQGEAIIHAGYLRLLEDDEDRAAQMLSRVLNDADGSPLLRFAAAVGQAHLVARRAGSDAAMRSLDRAAREIGVHEQLYYQLLLADQQVILLDRSNREVYRAYLDLVDSQPHEQRESVRRIVLKRLAGHADRFNRLADAPPVVRIAHEWASTFDEDELDRAIERLELLRERAAMNDRESALAMLILAGLYSDVGRGEDAAKALLALGRSHSEHPDAMSAVESALAHAVEAYRTLPSRGRPLLREGFDLLFTKFPQSETVDHWRLTAGRLAIHEEDFDAAMNHFERIARSSEQWREALFMQVEAERRAAQQAVDAEQRLVRLIERIEQVERDWQEANSAFAHERMMLQVYRSEAYLGLDDARRALNILDELEELVRADDFPSAVIAEMLSIRIRAYEAIGQADRASEAIDRLVGASPERAFELLLPMIDASEQRVGRLIRQHRADEAIELAQRELLPLAARLERWHDRYGSAAHSLIVGRRLADAHRYGGDCQAALRWYEELLEEHPNALPLVLGRAECLFALSESAADPRLAEAMSIYRRIAAARTERDEEPYWLSQLRMLQILDRIDRNTERILPRIMQLRRRDPDLGGEYFRRQFEQLQTRYGQ